jgi:acyl carrier protein
MNTKENGPIPVASSTAELQREVAQLLVECLNLEVTADQIPLDEPLYGEGLGMDSIDVLEVALAAAKRYGVQLRADSADNEHIFSSLRNLADHIAARRTR